MQLLQVLAGIAQGEELGADVRAIPPAGQVHAQPEAWAKAPLIAFDRAGDLALRLMRAARESRRSRRRTGARRCLHKPR
ncbi:hypothetical protein LXT12_22800 [Pelomonas sp. P7]|uniref:Uncharacterized protein n=1 Tax=Pelomonas caseinilytica TaxID=2906763 RepID=A0ABS8XGT1_9BURK|nr:hypothetical protein [Pelomonas sp. P7]MCE4540084.1 hypothetical protein [Pelomonas sp. P7]